MKKFKITYNVGEFTVPDNATDEQYDELRAIELIDAPDEIKAKYVINKDCQD